MAITKVTSGLISADAASVDLNIDAGTLYVDSTNNRVGVANTSPSDALDVTGNIVVSGTVDGRDLATDGSKLDGIESGATADQTQSEINALGITATGLSGTPNITVGTIDSGAITTTGNGTIQKNIPMLRFISADGSSNSYSISGNINDTVDGGFFIQEGTTNGTNVRLAINATGNVGIGDNTNPATNLHIKASEPQIRLQHSGNSYFSRIITDSSNNLLFGTGPNGTERMRIDSGGTIGMGGLSGLSPFILRTDYNGITTNSGYSSFFSTVSGAMAIFGHNVKPTSTANTVQAANTGYHSHMIRMYYDHGIAFHTTASTQTAGTNIIENANQIANERMRITPAGNVGIGTDNPSASLHILNTSGGQTPASYLNIQGATANNSNYPGVLFTGGNLANVYPYITLSNGGLALSLFAGRHTTNYNNAANITLQGSTGDIIFSTNSASSSGVEKMRLRSDGYLNVKDGILFGSDSAAANALDDYEEGTWSTTFSGTSGATATWSQGYYTKIGNMVFANFAFNVDSQINGDNYVVLFSGPFVMHQNNITWTGYCTNYSQGDRRSGIVINNSSGNNTQWFVGWKSNSTVAGTVRGVIVYQTTT